MNMAKMNWSTLSSEPISEAAIRALHSPQENFKIYVNTYQAGNSFPAKAGHAFTLYVLTGSCKITIDSSETTLSAAEWVALEKGSYTFHAVGNEELTIVKVFSLS